MRWIDVEGYRRLPEEVRQRFEAWRAQQGIDPELRLQKIVVVDDNHVSVEHVLVGEGRRRPQPVTELRAVTELPPAEALREERDGSEIVRLVRNAIAPIPVYPWQEQIIERIFAEGQPPVHLTCFVSPRRGGVQ